MLLPGPRSLPRRPSLAALAAFALVALAPLASPAAALASDGAPDGRDAPLLSFCGEGDGALATVASAIARRRLSGEKAPSADELSALVREAGAPYPWPRTLVLAGKGLDRAAAASRVRSWVSSLPGGSTRRCGVASAQDDQGEEALAVVSAPAPADLQPLPARVRPGAWVTVDARVKGEAFGAKLLVMGPRGAPRVVPATFSEGRLFGRFSADRPGAWLVQVLADRPEGPVPVIEALLRAGNTGPSDDEWRVPGEDERGPSPEATLGAMLASARASEGLPALAHDAKLDEVAQAHARRMAEAGRLGHDAGQGDPEQRLEAAGVELGEGAEVGENVAHAPSAAAAHRALWQSPSHRANVVSSRYQSFGLGLARGADGSLWVAQLFVGR